MSECKHAGRTKAKRRGNDSHDMSNPLHVLLRPVGRQWTLGGAVLVLGALLSLWGLLAVRDLERRRVRTEFEHAAADRAAAIEERLESHILLVSSVASFLSSSNEAALASGEGPALRQAFGEFATLLLANQANCQALEWIPRVPHELRRQFEAAAGHEGLAGFQITDRLIQGQMAPAAVRDEYFPVYFVEPLKGNEQAVGFDLASNAVRAETLYRCRDTGEPVATGRIVLVQETGKQFGFLVFAPVYRDGERPDTVAERRASLLGFGLGVFRLGDIVQGALARLQPRGIDLSLLDASAPPDSRLLHFEPSRRGGPPGHDETSRLDGSPDLAYRTTFDVAGRRWAVVCTADSEMFLSGQRLWLHWAAFVTGLALTVTLAGYLVSMARKTRSLKTLAVQLHAANQDLSDEVVKRRQAQEQLAELARFPGENPSPVLRIAGNGRILYANEASKALFADGAGAGAERTCPEWQRHVRRALESAQTQRADWTQGERTFSLTVAPIVHGDYANFYALDVTERERARRDLEDLNEKLSRLALTDTLTELPNRRNLVETLERELQRIQRYGGTLATVTLNLDHFKAVCEAHGHAMGDSILAEVGALLPSLVRRVDSVGRYGGDEFVVLMPQASTEEAVAAAERIVKRVAAHAFSDGRQSVKVTLSAGVSMATGGNGMASEGLLSSAEDALAAAKRAGRNCVRNWTPAERAETQASGTDIEQVEQLTRQVASLSRHAESVSMQSIWALVQALEARDTYTRNHSENVTRYAVGIALTMSVAQRETEVLRRAAMVHDIGKIGVPDDILRKTDPLTDDEWQAIRGHVLAGVRILKEVRILQPQLPLVRCHHERWDGRGYPEGIAGQAIPLGARILAVADALDAITTDRVYRKARGLDTALEIITAESGKQFDPAVAEALTEWVRRVRHQQGEDISTGHLLAASSVSISLAEPARPGSPGDAMPRT